MIVMFVYEEPMKHLVNLLIFKSNQSEKGSYIFPIGKMVDPGVLTCCLCFNWYLHSCVLSIGTKNGPSKLTERSSTQTYPTRSCVWIYERVIEQEEVAKKEKGGCGRLGRRRRERQQQQQQQQ